MQKNIPCRELFLHKKHFYLHERKNTPFSKNLCTFSKKDKNKCPKPKTKYTFWFSEFQVLYILLICILKEITNLCPYLLELPEPPVLLFYCSLIYLLLLLTLPNIDSSFSYIAYVDANPFPIPLSDDLPSTLSPV